MAESETKIGEVWNILKEAAPMLLQNNQSVKMQEGAFAVPKGKHPSDLDRRQAQESDQLRYVLKWGSYLTDYGYTQPTEVTIGVKYMFGARYKGRGRYIYDAEMWAKVENARVETWNISGNFTDAFPENNTAVLTGKIKVSHYMSAYHLKDYEFLVKITGTGDGSIKAR